MGYGRKITLLVWLLTLVVWMVVWVDEWVVRGMKRLL